MSELFSHAYLTEGQKEKLRDYRYAGSDASFLLRGYRPVLEWVVEKVGLFVSPNLITLLGFLSVNSAAGVTLWTCPTLSEPMPRWVYAWNALSIWAYQWLDNLDGKQARRTKTSSAFGEIFDHGVDAYASTSAAICFIAALQLGTTPLSLLTPFLVYFPFFFATWEQYWLGRMDLGVINGAMEGIFTLVVAMAIGTFFGGGIYQHNLGGMRTGEAAAGFCVMLAAGCVMGNVKSVVGGVKWEDVDGGIRVCMKQIMPLLTLVLTTFISTYGLDMKGLSAEGQGVALILVNGLLFGEIGTDLTLSHLSGVSFRTFFPTFTIPLLLSANRLSEVYFLYSLPQPPLVWAGVFLLSVYTLVYKSILIGNITSALNINFLSLTAEQKARLVRSDSPSELLP